MYYTQNGNPANPAILFLHALGTSGQMWTPISAALQADFYCIVVDLPGHGQSADIPWTSLTDVALQLKTILIKETPTGKAHIAGLSFGAYAGLTFIRSYPECVQTAFLSGINVLPLPHKGLMKIMGWLISKVISTDFMIRMNARMLKIPNADLPAYRTSLKELNTTAYRKANEEALTYTIPGNPVGITPLTLFIAGQKEHKLVIESLQLLLREVPLSSACLVKDLGHGWSAENPGLFAEALNAWITSQKLPDQLLYFCAP